MKMPNHLLDDVHCDAFLVSRDFEQESGQASVLLLLMLSTFLLAMMAFAVDLTSIWSHRQAAQSAADAACLAGASDMLALNLGVTPPGSGFTPGTNSDCVTSPAAAPCKYAGFNGYPGGGLQSNAASTSVSWTFPSSVPGATRPTGPKAPAYPFLQVNIVENVKTFFMGLVGKRYQQLNATASCGEAEVLSAPPLLILDPTASPSVSLGGSSTVTIFGGPPRSIQVNSTSANAVSSGGVNTTGAGPNLTGGDFAVVGPQTAVPSGYQLGTGNWIPYALPYADPLASVTAPTPIGSSQPNTGVGSIPYQQDGCPDTNGCHEFYPGYYSKGISVKLFTAIFRPGIYVVDGDFSMDANAVVRNAYPNQKQASLTTNGVMFYMRTGTVNVASNSGGTVADSVSPTIMSCDGTLPPGVPSAPVNGSILNAQCVDDGTYAGSGGTGTEASTGIRGLLFFEAHTNTSSSAYRAQGGGAFLLSGTEYFHTNSNSGLMQFGGNPSGTTYLLGYIVTDDLAMSGTPAISMVLSQRKLFITLKIGLFS